MYINQKEVNEIDQQIKSINEKLALNRFGIKENKIFTVGLSIKQKGNKGIIEKLKFLGFKIVSREKIRTFGSRTIYKGYEMSVILQKELNE